MPADAIVLAERLGAAGLPFVSLVAGDGVAYVTAAPEDASDALDPHDDRGELGAEPRWIGMIPYEARRGLERPRWSPPDARAEPLFARPSWLRYDAVLRVAGGVVRAVGSAAAAERLERAASVEAPPREPLVFDLELPAGEEHLVRVAQARELILAGDLYQVNLARRFELRLGSGGLGALLELTRGARFGALVPAARGVAVSLSPELLLRAKAAGGAFTTLRTEPIKGTRPRGADAASDRALAAELDADPKERAELAMIIDVVRGDLARVCRPGSVEVITPPQVRTHPAIHHREAVLGGTVRAGVSRREVIEALVPSGSVTGAPKVRAMEVIAELESHRRGLYTGGIGYIARDGSLELGMAIRTLELDGSKGVYWAGGGIVADSDPARELAETEWKARRLLELAQR